MIMRPFLAILLILTTFTLTSAMPRPRKTRSVHIDETKLLTNSARFRAGLGPMKPRIMFAPTRVRAAEHSASPSPSPRFATRTIEVRYVDNISIGFISTKLNKNGSLGLTRSSQDKLLATHLASSSTLSNLAIYGNHPFLGFSGERLVSPDAPIHNYLVEMERTPPMSPSQFVRSSFNDKCQSSVWSYDKNTHQLTAHWTNENGESVPAIFWYHTRELALGLVNSTSLDSSLGKEVSLYLV